MKPTRISTFRLPPDLAEEVLWDGDPIAGEGDTRTDPYYTLLRISGLVDGQVTNP